MLTFSILFFYVVTPVIAQVTVFDNVRVIDGTGRPAIQNTTFVVSQKKIHSIGPLSSRKRPALAKVVDLNGKTIIPGIINLHGHVGTTNALVQNVNNYTRKNIESNLRTYAQYGVTSTTSIGTDLDLLVQIRKEQERGHLTGARIYTALQGFTARGGYPTHIPEMKNLVQEITGAAQARHRVDQLASNGADAIKMWIDDHHGTLHKLSPEIYKALIQQARKRRLKSFAHVYKLEDAKRLVRSGVDVVAHSVLDQEVDSEMIALLRKHGTTVVSTLTREKSKYIYADAPPWLEDEFFTRSVNQKIIQSLRTYIRIRQSKDPKIELNRKNFRIAKYNLKQFAKNGVSVGFGTDTGPPTRFPGVFEHWEMELMVEAGLTPMQVITSFSKNAAEALGVSHHRGTLASGKAADFVVLNMDPLQDIRNTREIHSVYIGGIQVH